MQPQPLLCTHASVCGHVVCWRGEEQHWNGFVTRWAMLRVRVARDVGNVEVQHHIATVPRVVCQQQARRTRLSHRAATARGRETEKASGHGRLGRIGGSKQQRLGDKRPRKEAVGACSHWWAGCRVPVRVRVVTSLCDCAGHVEGGNEGACHGACRHQWEDRSSQERESGSSRVRILHWKVKKGRHASIAGYI